MYRRALTILTVAIAAGLIAVLGLGIVAAQQTASAERTIDEMPVAAGEKVTVAIAAANYGLGGTVTETLPDGFRYVPLSSSLDTDDTQVRDNGQEVTFVLIGRDVSFTYEVTTSDTEPPPYTFSGQLSGVDGPAPVTGDDTVTLTGDDTVPVDEATPEPGVASAERTIDEMMVAAGEKVTVAIAAANYGLGGTVTETLPDGFRYVPLSSSLDTDDTQVKDNGQEVTFVLIGRDESFTYEVTTSDTEPPPYTFSGQLSGVDGSAPVTGDDTVTVEEAATPEPGAASAMRSFDTTTVAPEGQLTVTITAANYGLGGTVTETLPDGFSYVPLSSSLETDDSQVRISGQEVTFVLIGGNVSLTYEVTASTTAGAYSFSGQLDGVDGSAPVRGDSSVTVGATATRTFDRTTVAPNGRLTVTITAANYGLGGTVTEMLPDGFSYVPLSSNLETDDSQVRISGQEVTFVLIGRDESFTYKVTASPTARSYSFSGQLNGVDGSAPVVGTSSVSVRRASTGGGGTGGGGGSGSGSGGDTGGGGTPATTTPVGRPPIIEGGTREEFNVPENMTAVTSLSVVDGRTVTWSISGGFDAAEFTIGADSGELMFRAAPDFENPTDAGANNVYVVEVGATDSDTLSDTLLVLVTVTDVADESTATPEATVAPTATPVPTATPTAEPTATPAPTAAPTLEPTATSMPEPTATSMPVATATSMPVATATSAPVATATSMPAAIATSMPVAIATSMPEPTATSMPEPTATSMPAPTAVAPEEPGGGFPILVVGLIALVVVVVAGAAFYIRSRR